jgi:hypothetical protein
VTADSPQPAAAEAPQSSAQGGSTGQQAGNQQLRIAILVVVAALVGVGLWLAFGNSSKNRGKHGTLVTIVAGPSPLSKRQLVHKAGTLGQSLYWIGPKRGYRYEYSRYSNGHVYVRYLPKGVKAGKEQGKLLIVATYVVKNAFPDVKQAYGGRGVAGKHGSFIVPSKPGDKKAVLIAWPGGSYQVEVYSPTPGVAATIAASGKVTKVG